MAIQLGSAYAKVSMDSSGVTSGVNSAIGSMSKLAGVATALGNTLTNVGQSMTIGLTLPILAMGAASIKAASDYEETKNKAVVVFGEMADAIVENSDRAATALGMSKQQYLDYAASLGAAFTAGGMGIKDSTELAEQAVKHFADLASFHNAQVEDVALAWQSAIRGQYEPIQRYFPFITDSYLKTYGIANNLVDANTKNLTANQRAIILNAIAFNEELNPAVNDFAETSKGLANSTRIMKAEFQNALVTLGTNLLPIALKVVQGLNRMLEAFNAMPPGVQKAIIVFAGFLALLGPLLSFLGTIISFIGGIMSLATTVGGLGISFAAVASAVGAAGSVLLAFAGAALSALGSILLLAAGPVLLYLAFKNNFMGITTTAKQLWFIIKFAFSEGWKWLVNSVKQGGVTVWNGFKSMIQRVVQLFRSMNWRDLGRYMILGIINGLLGGIPALVQAAIRAAKAVLSAIKTTLKIKSPSEEFMKIGAFSGQGFRMGLEKMMDPGAIAKSMAKPSNSFVTSSRTNYQMNFGNGLTVRDVDRLMEQKLGNFTRQLTKAVGAA
jgi:hypothetical protein